MSLRFLCRKCHATVSASAKVCIECGTKLDQRSRVPLANVPSLDSSASGAEPKTTADEHIDQPEVQRRDVADNGQSTAEPVSSSIVLPPVQPELAAKPSEINGEGPTEDPAQPKPQPQLEREPEPEHERKPERKPQQLGRPFGGVKPTEVQKDPEPPEPVPAVPSTSGPPRLDQLGENGASSTAPKTKFWQRRTPQVACPHCGQANEKGLTFCVRCREPLWVSKGRKGAPKEIRDPLYRRIMGTGRSGGVDNRLWSQRLRDRELDGTLRHRSGMAPKVRLAFAAVVLALVAIVVLVLGPLRRPLTSLFLPPTEEIQFVAALSGTADQSRDPSSLSDGSAESALNLPWQGSVAAPACGSPEAQTIRLEFDPARSPQLLRLYVGVDPVEEGVSPELFPGPRLISLRGEGECREPFDIGTQTGWVSLDVAEVAGQGGWIEIGVFSRWENSNVLTNDSVSIAEIELLE